LLLWSLAEDAGRDPEKEFMAHGPGVAAVCFSRQGDRVACGSFDGTVCAYTLTEGHDIEPDRVFKRHTVAVNSVSFSPESDQLLSGCADGKVYLWNVESGDCTAVLAGHTGDALPDPSPTHFSPSGNWVASGSKGNNLVTVREIASGDYVAATKRHGASVDSLSFSQEGDKLSSGWDDGSVHVWSLAPGAGITREWMFEGHTDRVWSVSFSPDGNRVASGSSDKTVRVWSMVVSADQKAEQGFNGHKKKVVSLCFSPKSDRMVSGSEDGTVCVWSLASGTSKNPERVFRGHAGRVTTVNISRTGERVASGSSDETVRVWSLVDHGSGKHVEWRFRHPDRGKHPTAISASGDMMAGDKVGVLWVARRRRKTLHWDLVAQLDTHTIRALSFSPAGDQLAIGSINSLRVRSVVKSAGENRDWERRWLGPTLWSVSFSPKGDRLASGDDDGNVWVSALKPGSDNDRELVFKGHADNVTTLNFSIGGNQLVSGSDDKTVRVWSLAGEHSLGQQQMFEGHTESVRCVSFSPLGDLVASGSEDRTVRVWDLFTGLCCAEFELAGPVLAVWWNDPARPGELWAACAMQMGGVYRPIVYGLHLREGPSPVGTPTFPQLAVNQKKSAPKVGNGKKMPSPKMRRLKKKSRNKYEH